MSWMDLLKSREVNTSVKAHGGRYGVRAGRTEVLQGDYTPRRFVSVEFPDAVRSRSWWDSREYAPAKKIRHESARTDMFNRGRSVMASAFVEAICIEALKPYLFENQRTVGTHVDLSHCAATPVEMTVTAEVRLTEVAGRRLTFAVECRDEVELIGRGLHRRVIIDVVDFVAKAQAKIKKGSNTAS